jgi:hypothetical protein
LPYFPGEKKKKKTEPLGRERTSQGARFPQTREFYNCSAHLYARQALLRFSLFIALKNQVSFDAYYNRSCVFFFFFFPCITILQFGTSVTLKLN